MTTRGAKLRRKRAGRKPKPLINREPNGRVQRLPEAEQETRVMETALNQPHRQGMNDQRCENALGRFCIRLGLRPELYTAGEHYRDAIRRWRLAKGFPVEGVHSMGLGREVTADEVARLHRDMTDAMRTLIDDAGYNAHQAVRALIVEDMDLELTSERDGAAIDGLWSLAIHYGLLTARRIDNSALA